MNRLYTSGDSSSSCSSDTDDGSSSDDDGTENKFCKIRIIDKNDSNISLRKSTSQNIIFKLQNREVGMRLKLSLQQKYISIYINCNRFKVKVRQ